MPTEFQDQLVLVVDDDPYNCAAYKRFLATEVGCQVETVGTQQEALERLGREPTPALVLLDVCLQGTDPEGGYLVCRHVKQGGLRPEVQVVMITAIYDATDVLRSCLEAGADDFLAKTADDVEKLARIQSKLRAQRASVRLIEATRRAGVADLASTVHVAVSNCMMVGPVAIHSAIEEAQAAVASAAMTLQTAVSRLQLALDRSDAAVALASFFTGTLKDLAATGQEVREPCRVRDLVEQVVLFAGDLGRPTSELQNKCDPNFDAQVLISRRGVLMSLLELVGNVATTIADARARGTFVHSGVITLGAERVLGERGVQISVSGNGPDVPDSIRETLLDRAKQRVEREGGRIRHEPNHPAGARFIIELPEVRTEPRPPPGNPEDPGCEPPGAGPKAPASSSQRADTGATSETAEPKQEAAQQAGAWRGTLAVSPACRSSKRTW